MSTDRPFRSVLVLLVARTIVGCGESHDGADGGSPAEDAAPDAPAPVTSWDPPLGGVEPAGDSPFCHPYAGRLDGVELWADERGVFVVADVRNGPDTPYSSWPSGVVVQHHDSDDWSSWQEREHAADAPAATGVTGIEGGPVWIWQGTCWLRRIDGPGEQTCVLPGDPPVGESLVDVHMVEPGLGWYLFQGRAGYGDRYGYVTRAAGDDFLVGGGGLESDRPPQPPVEVWGDRAGSWAIDRASVYAGSTSLARRRDAPYGQYTALWVSDRDDVWVASRDGRMLRFDGERWGVHEAAGLDLRHLGGTPERMYFASPRAFGVWTPDGGARVLQAWDRPSLTVRDLYPAAEPGAVYLALEDREREARECGSLFVLRFEEGRLQRL